MLFDWRGTLFHDETDEDWIRASAASIGRKIDTDEAISVAAGARKGVQAPLAARQNGS